MHIALIICCLLILIVIIDMIHSYIVGNNINMDLISLIIPVVTLSLSDIFLEKVVLINIGIKRYHDTY